MSEAIAKQSQAGLGAQIERVLVTGDLASLTAEQRVTYYNTVCESVGLNPLTRPFDYITLNGKLTLYARRDCTDQLRKIHQVSIKITARETLDGDVYVVTAQATDRTGRADESTGAVPMAGLKGEARANAIMKAETKAKRRVTLSVCGLGMLDENEVESITFTSSAPPPSYIPPVSEAPPERLLVAPTAIVSDPPSEGARRPPRSVKSAAPATAGTSAMQFSKAPTQPTGVPASVERQPSLPSIKPSMAQVMKLNIAIQAMGIKDRDEKLRWCEAMLSMPSGSLKSSNDIPANRISGLIMDAEAGIVPPDWPVVAAGVPIPTAEDFEREQERQPGEEG